MLPGDIDLERGRVAPTVPRVVVAGKAERSETKTSSGDHSLALDPTTWEALRQYIVARDSPTASLPLAIG